jgi:UDPglucose--hexose-1-phosphate uridylyltransferase
LPQLRQDPIAGYWVALAKDRSKRPFDFQRAPVQMKAGAICPFCPGNENLTPPELLSYPAEDGRGGWRLRAFPNKYPAVDAHELIVESPEHKSSFGELPESAAVDLLAAVRDRMLALKQDPELEYVQFFKNNGPGSGASLSHPHSQLMALPFVPGQVQLELDGSLQHFEEHGHCIFCDLIDLEDAQRERVIFENEQVLVVAPYAPRFGFETWVIPRAHHSHFELTAEGLLRAVGEALHRIAHRLEAVLDYPPYNFLLHTAPVQEPAMEYYHWHIEILPRMSGVGGYEFGTGCYINAILPEEAAAVLRGDA